MGKEIGDALSRSALGATFKATMAKFSFVLPVRRAFIEDSSQ
jgi:hypothetical protein